MKRKLFLISGIIALSLSLAAGCSSSDDTSGESVLSEEELADNERYFEITNLINEGNYDEALTKLEERYSGVDYSDESLGGGKMIQYRLFYDEQGMYDEAATVALDYIEANPGGDTTEYSSAGEYLEEVKDKVSDDVKARIAQLTDIAVDTAPAADAVPAADTQTQTANTQSATSAVTAVIAEQLINDYAANEFNADQKYKGKVIQVSGIIYEISSTDDGGALIQVSPSPDSWDDVWCYFYDPAELQKISSYSAEQNITVEGLCEGYDFFIELSDCKIVG